MSAEQPRWDNIAESYQSWYQSPRGKRYDALEKALIGQLLGPPQGRRLLDIGCGTGHFTRWLHGLGWLVWGLDREREMVRWAQAHSSGEIPYCRADAEALPFADGSFHVCALITTLESTRHPQTVLREALRVSREMVLLGILNRLSILTLRRRVRAVFRPTIFSQTRFYTAPELCHMVKRAARERGVAVCLRTASQWGERLPLGAFYALAVDVQRHQARSLPTGSSWTGFQRAGFLR